MLNVTASCFYLAALPHPLFSAESSQSINLIAPANRGHGKKEKTRHL